MVKISYNKITKKIKFAQTFERLRVAVRISTVTGRSLVEGINETVLRTRSPSRIGGFIA